MAITYSIAPNPHWVLIDNFDRLPVGAAIYTFSSLNPSVYKPAYQDAGGTVRFTQPIVGFANGTMPPIFWAFDSNATNDLYYIQVWDKQIVPGGDAVMLWDFSGLSGGGSGGGGGTITTNFDLENLVVNGEFYRNAGNQAGPSIGTAITLAPSNHDGFCGIANGPTDGPPSPDIIFAKENQSASDTLTFVNFTQGDSSFSPNPTPQQYLKYNCTVAGTETYKYIQFPICKGLQNMNNINVSFQIWARYIGGNTNVGVYLRQFFGNGPGATADVATFMGTLSLTANTWVQTKINSFLIPGITPGNVIGPCGNDGLFLQIRFPLSDIVNIDFSLPALYLGTTTSTVDFHTLDEVDTVISNARTGDIRTSINSFYPFGWVPMNDGTIGSPTSSATTRANVDTFPLYDLIWNSISNTYAPVYAAGVLTTRGVTSIADFSANKSLALTRNLGRVMAGALPVAASQSYTRAGNTITMTSTAGFYTGMAVTLTGAPIPPPLVVGVVYYVILIDSTTMSIASTTANALAGTVIALTGAGSGTITSVYVETLGSYIGEERHIPTIAEMAAHNHPGSVGGMSAATGSADGALQGQTANIFQQTLQIASQGGGLAFNVIQPTTYMNIFVKL